MIHTNKHWDIFCKIVDNFGDIGVCWRLSQQLAHEHQLQVRLFIDDFNVAKKIITNLNIALATQLINGVEICSWPAPDTMPAIKPGHVALETFACGLPDTYLQQMQLGKTIWINLEYLSAEAWVSDFHAKSSPHPTLALTKHYFFPGFFNETGGLIRESNLMTTRDKFLNSTALQQAFWHQLGVKDASLTKPAPINISLFCYPQANISDLFSALMSTNQAIRVFMPTSTHLFSEHDVFAGFKSAENGKIWHQGNLTVYQLPFLSQADYDKLLWACDLNFVRGEDSWIRAIWAKKPFIWQPYIQEDDTHIHKLKAFLEAYTHNATPEVQSALFDAHLEWSKPTNAAAHIWSHFISQLSSSHTYISQQTQTLSKQADLASKLVIFSENLMKK